MRDGLAWERVWLFGDEELSRGSGVWEAGPRGKLTIQAMLNEGSFAPGVYKLEIYGAGQLLTKGTFLVVKEDTSTQRPVHLVYTTWDGKKHRLDLLNLATNQTGLLLESAHSPAWSADAKELLFYNESGAAEGPPGLWIFNIAQGKTYPINKEISFKSVAWSPHHAHLASTLTAGAETRLVLWDLTRHRVSDGPAGADPVWSPEGLRLAYRSCDQAGWHISTVQVIGSNFDTNTLRHLTSGDDSQPAWSWNGQWVAFVRREGDNQDIYIVRADGSSLMRLTDHPAADVSPAWTPDHRLVFRSLRDGQWYIYLMNADGSDQHQLVSTGSPPEWQSDRLAVSTNVLVAEPPQPEPQLQIPAGHGLLAVSNQVNNDEMTFTIDNVEHKIGPFQLRMLPLKPGRYTWTASWPGKTGRTGIADIGLGQVAYPIVER
jgi:TolB protein